MEVNYKLGGAKEDRTPDLYNAIVALSQLSYGPTFIYMPLSIAPFRTFFKGELKNAISIAFYAHRK